MKKPFCQWTSPIAPTMINVKLKAQNRVKSPSINARAPRDSPMITRKATTVGIPIPVKNSIVPTNPYPPNQPNNFCAPCGNITPPKAIRNKAGTQSSVVPKNCLTIFSFLSFPVHRTSCSSGTFLCLIHQQLLQQFEEQLLLLPGQSSQGLLGKANHHA